MQSEPLESARGARIRALPGIDQHLEVLSKLGQGAFGSAHLVLDKTSGQRRVLKAVRKDGNVPREVLDQEVAVLKALDHPHIVRIFGHYEDYRFLYILMEPAEGGELLKVITDIWQNRHKQLDEAWAARVFQQSLSAIAYCHARGVLHKDLKGENIMLLGSQDRQMAQPHALIIDFGVAELIHPGKGVARGSIQAGTCTTMAPEVRKGNFGPKCDVWSIGCVLFEVLCGKFAFLAKNLQDDAEWLRIQQAGPDWNHLLKVSGHARHLCARLLVFDERVRPTAEQCLRHHWFTLPAGSQPAPTLCANSIQALCDIQKQSTFERAICFDIASSLNVANFQGLAQVFQACDVDNSGCLSVDEVANALSKAGIAGDNAAQIAQTLRASSNRIEFTMFVSALLSTCQELLDECLWKEFTKLDTDRSGYLCKDELRQVLRSMQCESQMNSVWAEVDISGDGRVSFDEFQKYFRRHTPMQGEAETATSKKEQSIVKATSVCPSSEVDALLNELEDAGLIEAPMNTLANGSFVPADVAEALFENADLDSNGDMTSQEFLRWTLKLLQSPHLGSLIVEAGVSLDFHVFDKNQDSKLDRDEWQELLDALAEVVGPSALRKVAEDWCAPKPTMVKYASPCGMELKTTNFKAKRSSSPIVSDEVDDLLNELGF